MVRDRRLTWESVCTNPHWKMGKAIPASHFVPCALGSSDAGGQGELRPHVHSICVSKDATQNPSSCALGERMESSARCPVCGRKHPWSSSHKEGIPVTLCRAHTSHKFQLCSCELILMQFGGCEADSVSPDPSWECHTGSSDILVHIWGCRLGCSVVLSTRDDAFALCLSQGASKCQ